MLTFEFPVELNMCSSLLSPLGATIYAHIRRVLPTLVGMVRSNHHSAFLTTTQVMFDSIYSNFNMEESLFS